jgi:DNA-binding PadR family transcriptional regulator
MIKTQHHHVGSLSPEMALLGLLYGGPMHGYDLHRKVNTELGEVWHLSQSQAYSILKRLEIKGDISVEEIPQEKLPPRQMLHMTAKGHQRFVNWLDTPCGGSVRGIRMEFVTRLYFLGRMMPEKIPQAFDKQRVEAKRHLHRLERKYAELPADQTYNRMSLEMRLRELKVVLDWLEDCQKKIK